MLARQRGVAVITALLLTTLAITIVASLFWAQQVQVRSMENQRLHLQTKWILRGALDWAGLVLRQDGNDNPTYTALTAVWATPLAETRLDQYIERERVQGEVFDATLSGNIIDATSRYNLTNLAQNRKVNSAQVEIYKRLLTNLRLDASLAQRTALAVAKAQVLQPNATSTGGGGGQVGGGQAALPVPPSTDAPLSMTQVDDLLAIPGYTLEVVSRLREFVIVLPEHTTVNVNTAPPEVLAAVVENLSIGAAGSLAARRKSVPWRDIGQFTTEVAPAVVAQGTADVKSDYFLVQSRIRLDRAALDAEALINRPAGQPRTSLEWVRQN
ncbi:MAG: type II secretion system minor pseudopilin GspK [Pseudomonadota bacterium]|nr:type II secretion system minor pseudopilin GspK [Pseudomonadota bacterium]